MWRGPLLLLLMISRAAALRNQQVTSVTDEVDEVCGQECHLINPAGENYYVGFREVEGSPEELKAGSQYDLRTSPCGETSDEPPRKITIAPTGEKDRHGLVKGELQRKLEWSLNHIEKLQDGEIRICTSGEQPRCICKLDASFLETKKDTEHFLWACLPLAAFACGVGFFSGILYAAYRLKDGFLKNPSKDCGQDDERSVCVVSHGLDDDTKDRSLKNPSKEHRSSPSTTSKSPALSIRQIRDRWLWAFGSCLVALSCGTPFLGILTTGAMFWLYSCSQTHRLFLVEAPQRIPLPVQVLTEGILWTSLFQACIYTIVTYTKRYLRLFASDTSNMKVVTQKILAEAEVGVIVVACTFGSTILWRVLLINAMEIAQNVHEHRQRVTLPPKAREIWKQLQDKFDKYFPKKEPPATFTELRLRQDSKDKIEKDIFGEVDLYSIDKALIFTSTLVLGVSLIVLQCQLDWTASHEERVPGYLAWRRRGIGRYLYAGLGGGHNGVCGSSPLVPAHIRHCRRYQKVQATAPTHAAFLLPGHHLEPSGT
ncbi:unnamed protein product [Symbiodinium sp. CCMP2456]|nr:unnamed protein product [Symbiodinium sp. CCMP2456]